MPSAAHLVMDLFAWVALQTGRAEQAAQIAGRSAQIKRERDWASEPAERALIEDTLAGLHAAFDAEGDGDGGAGVVRVACGLRGAGAGRGCRGPADVRACAL